MIDRTSLAVLFWLLSFTYGLQCPKQMTSPGREVVCYTSVSNVDQLTDAVCKCTTLVQRSYDVQNISISDFEGFRKSLKEISPTLQFMISVNDPGKKLRTSGTVRQEIAARLVGVLKEVDGVELNMTAGSKERLFHFVKGLKDELARKSYDKRIFLVLPTKSEDLAKQFDLKELSEYVDLFTISTHYLVEDDEAYHTFHPSRLMGLFDIYNADSLIDLISGLGAPKRKILISVPASAYKFTLKDQDDNAPRASTVEMEPIIIDQKQLCKLMNNGEWTVERDEDLTAPYAFKDETWIAFEDKISIAIKGKYVLIRDLPGLAIHDIENDFKTDCGIPLTYETHHSFSDFKRKSRATVLNALEDDLHQIELEYSTKVKSSDFRVARVIDTEGHIRVVRENTQTEFTCSRQGYFVHPKSCNRFYRCVKFNQEVEDYSVFEFDCPAGLSFDERTEVCVWPGSMPEGSPCPGSSEIAPVTRVRFECPTKPGYYADPQNPRWFFACIDLGGSGAMAYEFRCPYGLIFDEQKLVCEWPWLVQGYSETAYTRPEYDNRAYGGTGSTPGTGGYYTGGLPHGYTGTTVGGAYSGSTGSSGYSGAGAGFSGAAGVGYTGSHGSSFGPGKPGAGYSGSGTAGSGHGPSYGGQGSTAYSGTTGSGYSGSETAGHGISYGGHGASIGQGTTGSGIIGHGYNSQGPTEYSGTIGSGPGFKPGSAGHGSSYGGQGSTGHSGATSGTEYSGSAAAGHGSSYDQGSTGYAGTTGNGYSGSGTVYTGSGHFGPTSGINTGSQGTRYTGTSGSGHSGTSGIYTGTAGTDYTAGSGSSSTRGHDYTGQGIGHGTGTLYTGSTAGGYSGSNGARGGSIGTSYTGSPGDYSGTTGTVHGGYSGSSGTVYTGKAGTVHGGYSGSSGTGYVGSTGTVHGGYSGAPGTASTGTVHGGYSGSSDTGYSGSTGTVHGGYSGAPGTASTGTVHGGYSGSSDTGYSGSTGTVHGGYSGAPGTASTGTVHGGYSGSSDTGYSGSTGTVHGGYSGSSDAGYSGSTGTVHGGYSGSSGTGYSGSTGTVHGGYSGSPGTGSTGTVHGGYTGSPGTGSAGTVPGGYSGSSDTGYSGSTSTVHGGYSGTTDTRYSGSPGTGTGHSGFIGGSSPSNGIYGGYHGTTYSGSVAGSTAGTYVTVTEGYSGSDVKGGSYYGSPGVQYSGPTTPGSGGNDYSDSHSAGVTGNMYTGQTGTKYSHGRGGSATPGQGITLDTHPPQTSIYVSPGATGTGILSPEVTSIHAQTPGPIIVEKPDIPNCATLGCYEDNVPKDGQTYATDYLSTHGINSQTNVYQGTHGYTGGLNTTFPGSHVPSIGGPAYHGTITPANGYGITGSTGTGAVVTGHNIQGSIATGDSTPGTLITYGDTSGSVISGSSNQGSIVTGVSHPGYTQTGSGTPGYVINDGVKTVYSGSPNAGPVIYGTPSPNFVVTGAPSTGTIIKGQSSPGIILTGQTEPGVSVGGSIDQGTIIGSTGHRLYPDSSYQTHQAGVTSGSQYGTKIGTVSSTYGGTTGYKTNEYHDNGGRGTIKFNNGDVTTKYTENDIPDYRPAGGIIHPDTLIPGSKIVPGVSTPSGFTKTGPTKTGFTTATLGGGGSYVISTGNKRPTPKPDNIGVNAFEGNVAGYTESSSESTAKGYATHGQDFSHVDTSRITLGPSKNTGYSYPTPSIPFETGVSKNIPVSHTENSVLGPATPTPFLNVEVYNTPKVGDSVLDSSPGFTSTYQRPSGFTKAPGLTGAHGVYTTGPLVNYKTTAFQGSKIPASISTVQPVSDTGYQTVVSSTPIPVTLSEDTYDGGVQTGYQFEFGTKTKQGGYQNGYVSSTTPSSSFGVTPTYSRKPQINYGSTTASSGSPYFDSTSKPIFGQSVTPSGTPGLLKPQTQYLPSDSVSPGIGVTYKKPFSLPDVTYQYSTPIPPVTYTNAPSGYSTTTSNSPANVAIHRDQVGKLITNYNRGTTKYVPSEYDVYTPGSTSGVDYSRPQTSSNVQTLQHGYRSSTQASISKVQSSYPVATYSTPSSIITYQTTAKSTAVGKGKVIVKWSDLHPLLLGKLGAECTCRGDPFANLRGPGSKLIDSSNGKVDLSNYDESEIYVDLEKEGSYEDKDYVTNYESSPAGPTKIWNNEIPKLLSSSSTQISERPSSTYLPGVTTSANIDARAGVSGFSSNHGFIGNHRSGKSLSSSGASTNGVASRGSFIDSGAYGESEETLEGATNCARPGLFRHPNFCNKFYACHWDDWKKKFTLHVFNCPVHLTFDNGVSACNWPSMGPACQDDNLLV